MPSIHTIGVLGAGQMGNGIAHVAAQAGYEVLLHDIDRAIVERALETIGANMAREVNRGKIDEAARTAALARIRGETALEALGTAELVIEAAPENPALKADLYARLAPHLKADSILASNTSSISITWLGAQTPFPERVVGMHFFNPVPVMELVELIRGMATSDATHAAVRTVAERMGRRPVESRDAPGFIANRILVPMLNEAIFALHEGVGGVADIDAAIRLGLRHPMGPLTLADYIGLDTLLAIARVLHEGLGDPKYRPCPLLVRLVDAGWLGVKSGRGFYDYGTDPPTPAL